GGSGGRGLMAPSSGNGRCPLTGKDATGTPRPAGLAGDGCMGVQGSRGAPVSGGAPASGGSARVSGGSVPGPGGGETARLLAGMLGDPLAGYLRLAARYGDVVRVPFAPRRYWFVLSRPEHAEHVLAANQDNYVKAFTYRPLRALVGNGLLTSEGQMWRRHRRWSPTGVPPPRRGRRGHPAAA